jgi:putative ATP-dependent endonuclease of OLD family
MRTKLVSQKTEGNFGYGAGEGTTEYYEYECPCGEGRIVEEHDNIPGFREHDVYLLCAKCRKAYVIDTSLGIRNWRIVRKEGEKLDTHQAVKKAKTQPYISRIHIENFRNFHSVDFALGDKQVIIGENAVGKSNLLYALQLIFDPTLSERDRMLEESDFWDGLENPMDTGCHILIEVYLKNFEDNKNLFAQLADASVICDGEEALKITYKFFKKDAKKPDYSYVIYKGDDETRAFTYEDRKMLNIRVIKAIRDVEAEMRSARTSPLTQIIKQKYSISKNVLAEISKALDEKGADTLHIGQVSNLETRLHSLLNDMIAFGSNEFSVSLRTMNVDATKLLYALRPLINSRETSNTSLGINNVLYVALVLLLIEDDTVKTYLSGELYRELKGKDSDHIIEKCYSKSPEGDEYVLNLAALENTEVYNSIYEFLSNVIPTSNGVTILAVEEPESHLHPIFQRLLYRHIMNKANTSVMVTTHSTHISSVAPITSLVHLISTKDGTCVNTTANLKLSESDFADLSRYIDVKRGELYTAKGIIFVEGIAEEFLIPSFARILGLDLDRLGIVVCNVNSTNFEPYCDFADALGIPYVLITDGDYYHAEDNDKRYNDLEDTFHQNKGFDGLDRCHDMFPDIKGQGYDQWSFSERREYFATLGAFVGEYTFEVDIFKTANENDQKIICSVFNQLTQGGERQKSNFESELSAGQYNKCLAKIESTYSKIGKGRFAQRLANTVSETMIPQYISKAIEAITAKVR